MASQPHILDQSQLQSVVTWLEEQRRADRQEIARLSSEIERLSNAWREQAAEIAELRTTLGEDRAAVERIPIVDEAVRQTREQIAELVNRFDDHAQRATQTLLLRGADAERDRKALGDLAQSVAKLERDDQALAVRVQALVDGSRRDREQVTELPKTIEAVENRLVNLAHRADQIEEMTRRLDTAGGLQRQEIEAIRTEQARMAQWRQLTDVRWTRQVAEWQQTIDNWRQAADEHARPVQHLIAQVAQARDELRAAQGALAEQQRRLGDAAATTTRLESALAQQREAIARLEQAMDGQRRRFDEQASAQLRLDEAIGRVAEHRGAAERVMDDHTRQIEEVRAAQRTTAADLERTRGQLAEGQVALRQESNNVRALAVQALQRTDEAARMLDERLSELAQMLHEQRQRQVLELEQQLRELGELVIQRRPD